MVDTNVLISGMVFGGSERRLLEVIRRCHTLVLTDYLLAEATEVLARKFPGGEGLLDVLLQSFKGSAHGEGAEANPGVHHQRGNGAAGAGERGLVP